MALDSALDFLKAAADPTRLRLLALLAGGEATVGELVEVLGQSQPRVSRHLRLLTAARLMSHFRDGHWVYYRLAPEAVESFTRPILDLARAGDAQLADDLARLATLRRRREGAALAMRDGPRPLVAAASGRPAEAVLRAGLEETLGAGPLGDVLDIGTGSGTVLRLLGARARSAVGIDAARGMRVLARARVQQAGLAHCTIRAGDMHALAWPDHSFDVVVLDEVLGLSPRPADALREALRVLRPAGRLIVLDRVHPAARRLPAPRPAGGLFENQLVAALGGLGLRLTHRAWFPGRTLEHALFAATPAPGIARTGSDG
jgi:DNA-binding transcriptional ArsR family regulator/protein-L-isoaspartate O-methyltransferase